MDENLSNAPQPGGAVDPPRPKRSTTVRVSRVLAAVLGIAVIGIALLLPTLQSGRGPSRRDYCVSNLHQISIALQLYAAAHGGLPPAYTTGPTVSPCTAGAP